MTICYYHCDSLNTALKIEFQLISIWLIFRFCVLLFFSSTIHSRESFELFVFSIAKCLSFEMAATTIEPNIKQQQQS